MNNDEKIGMIIKYFEGHCRALQDLCDEEPETNIEQEDNYDCCWYRAKRDVMNIINTTVITVDDECFLCNICGSRVDYGVAECPECKTAQIWFSR